jgi:hypothetical protein
MQKFLLSFVTLSPLSSHTHLDKREWQISLHMYAFTYGVYDGPVWHTVTAGRVLHNICVDKLDRLSVGNIANGLTCIQLPETSHCRTEATTSSGHCSVTTILPNNPINPFFHIVGIGVFYCQPSFTPVSSHLLHVGLHCFPEPGIWQKNVLLSLFCLWHQSAAVMIFYSF